jgi:phosphoribosyl 1,2-cyclic phosphate phosphodiesterase
VTSDFYQAIILGSGTSGGVPRLGGPAGAGNWGVCDPNDPKNTRTRCSLLLRRISPQGETTVLVDTSPDLRTQMLKARVTGLDGVFLSHEHADQLHGIDDLRLVYHLKRERVQVYAAQATAEPVRQRFSYCFEKAPGSDYPPIADLHIIPEPFSPFEISGAGGPIPVLPFWVTHGAIRAVGLRFGPLAYTSDLNGLDKTAFAALDGVDCWIVDALRYKPHTSHAHVALALEWIAKVKPKRAILTNLHIDLDYETLKRELPDGVEPAYDGMTIELPA